MKNILIAIDFHEKTQLFVEKAKEMAKCFGTKVWLLHVAAPDSDLVGFDTSSQSAGDSKAHELTDEHAILQEIKEQLIAEGIDTEALLVQGPTIESVLEKAHELKVDLIVSGHHRHGFLYRAFYGDTTSKLIKKSKIPVLVVPFDS